MVCVLYLQMSSIMSKIKHTYELKDYLGFQYQTRSLVIDCVYVANMNTGFFFPSGNGYQCALLWASKTKAKAKPHIPYQNPKQSLHATDMAAPEVVPSLVRHNMVISPII